jgi:hypothetical protein
MADSLAAARAEAAYREAHPELEEWVDPDAAEEDATKPAGAVAESTPPASETAEKPTAEGAPSAPATAPANWPAAMREQFQQLPEPAKGIVLEHQRNLEAGFTQAMQSIAPLKSIADRFQQDPKSVLQELAEKAGLPVWFERPTPEDQVQVPEFATQGEMVEWLEKRHAEKVQRELDSRSRAFIEWQQQQQARSQLEQELNQAASLPNFDRQAVLDTIVRANGGLSAEEAHWLTQRGRLEQDLAEAGKAREELAALKAAQAQRAKQLTRVPSGVGKPGDGERREYTADELDYLAARRAERSMAGV